MKKIYFLFILLITSSMSFGQVIWFNEIHYDNSGGDVNEGFEIAGPATTDLSDYTVYLINGNGGTIYRTVSLSGTLTDQSNGLGTKWFDVTSMQNGAPDGLAIFDGTTIIQFLSYEGVITGVAGNIDGFTSTDIGIEEDSGTGVGESMQLTGTGNQYSDFTWSLNLTSTHDLPNSGQVLPVEKQEIANFSAFPNPVTNGEFFINSASNATKDVQIYDMLGKQVYSKSVDTNESLNVSNLITGIYILKVFEEGKTATRKLMIR